MYRVLVAALLSAFVAGCGMAASPLTAGFANSGQPTSSVAERNAASRVDTALATEPVKPAGRAADKAPKGTYEKAPQGALADRDYSKTELDLEKARQLINAYRKQHGLKPLALNTALTEAAKLHARDLAKWDRISHYGSDGSNPWDRGRARDTTRICCCARPSTWALPWCRTRAPSSRRFGPCWSAPRSSITNAARSARPHPLARLLRWRLSGLTVPRPKAPEPSALPRRPSACPRSPVFCHHR
jgi:hypothetical protein